MANRVLHVLDKIAVSSGVSAVVMNYYSKLDHNRLTFDFMLNEDVDKKVRAYIESRGSKIYIMPKLEIVNVFKYIKALTRFYEEYTYEIIHGHVANSAIFYLGLAKNSPHRIIHSHSTKLADVRWKFIRNWLLTRFIKFVANKYIACGEEAAKFLFGNINDVTILHNAIDTNKFRFSDIKRREIREFWKIKDEFVIGHVGRFTRVKNHDFLIDVFCEVHATNKRTKLMLIGDGEAYSSTMQKVKKLGLTESVLFIGVKENIEDYMSSMDILVLPSLFEGLGMVGIEAQTAGLKVLASEFVPQAMNITGNVIFLELDKSKWVNVLIQPEIGGSSSRLELGEKVIGSRFDIEIQMKFLYEYYEKLLQE